MHEMGLKCIKYNRRVRKYDSSKGPNGKKAKNKLNRRFMSNRKYQKMVCDITELKAHDGRKVYLEIIKDLATNQLLTWSVSQHPNLYILIKAGTINIVLGANYFVRETLGKACRIEQPVWITLPVKQSLVN